MVKITYDENNLEQKTMVEDYFWFKSYLNVIKFDILSNEDLTKYINIVSSGITQFMTYEDILEMETLIMDKLKSFMNMDDLTRLKNIFNTFTYYHEDSIIEIISYLDLYGIKYFKNKYKNLLINKFGEK